MVSATDLVGRDRELARIEETFASGRTVGATLLVSGEAGIGKTTLVAAARASARRRGDLVLEVVGVEAERELPFAGLQQLLAGELDRADRLDDRLRGGLLTALGLHDGPAPSLFLVAEAALAVLLDARATQPVAVLADDVQWLDPQTHEIVTFLGHRAAASRLTIVAVTRADHPGAFVDAGFPMLEVTGIDAEAAQELLARSAGSLTAVERRLVADEAQGNPLALLELPAVWRTSAAGDRLALPVRLERAFATRIADLPAPARDALLVAAVDSSDDAAEIVAAAAVMRGDHREAAVLDPARSAGLITVVDGRVRFRHPLVRSGVLQHESLPRIQDAHRALASSVTGDGPDARFRRTWHRAQSIVGPDDQIADELTATVADSLRRGAAMTAVSSLERASELTASSATRGHRLLLAAEHAFTVGRTDVVHRLVDDAARTELSELDWARMQWLREIFDDGVPGDAVRVLELCDVARRAAAASEIDLALNLLLGAALRCWWADTGPEARADVARTALELPAGPRRLATVAVAEPVLRAREVLDHLAAMNLAAVDDPDALRLYGMAAHAVGESTLATDLLDRAETLLRERVQLALLSQVLGMQVHIRHELGDWTGATRALREVERLAVETGQPIWSLNNVILEAHSHALHGRWRDALDTLAPAEIEARRRGLNDTLSLVQLTRGTALIAARRYDDAYDALSAQFDPRDPSHHPRESFASLAFLAEAAVHAGRVRDARRIVQQLEHVARVTPCAILHVHLAYARAVLAPEADAAVAYATAMEMDLRRWPWARARLAAAHGAFLSRTGQPEFARTRFLEALATFDELGATTWSREVSDQLAKVSSS